MNECSVSIPSNDNLKFKIESCANDWMQAMSNKHKCIEHFASIGSGSCTVSDLEQICSATNENFTIDDATLLCKNLAHAHAQFWPGFWNKFN